MEICSSPEFALGYLLLVDSLICEWHDAQVSLCREKSSFGLQEHFTSYYISFQHSLIQQKSAQRLTDNHIDRFQRNLRRGNVFNFSLNNFNDVLKAICFDQSSSYFSCSTRINSINFLCTSLSCKQGQNATTASNIHDNFASEVCWVLEDGLTVLGSSDSILHHVLLVCKLCIVAEVLLDCGTIVVIYPTRSCFLLKHLGCLSSGLLTRNLFLPGSRSLGTVACLLLGKLISDTSDLFG